MFTTFSAQPRPQSLDPFVPYTGPLTQTHKLPANIAGPSRNINEVGLSPISLSAIDDQFSTFDGQFEGTRLDGGAADSPDPRNYIRGADPASGGYDWNPDYDPFNPQTPLNLSDQEEETVLPDGHFTPSPGLAYNYPAATIASPSSQEQDVCSRQGRGQKQLAAVSSEVSDDDHDSDTGESSGSDASIFTDSGSSDDSDVSSLDERFSADELADHFEKVQEMKRKKCETAQRRRSFSPTTTAAQTRRRHCNRGAKAINTLAGSKRCSPITQRGSASSPAAIAAQTWPRHHNPGAEAINTLAGSKPYSPIQREQPMVPSNDRRERRVPVQCYLVYGIDGKVTMEFEEFGTSARATRPARTLAETRRRYTAKEDKLLLNLRGKQWWSWDQICEEFSGRSKGSLQVRYSNLCKRGIR